MLLQSGFFSSCNQSVIIWGNGGGGGGGGGGERERGVHPCSLSTTGERPRLIEKRPGHDQGLQLSIAASLSETNATGSQASGEKGMTTQ